MAGTRSHRPRRFFAEERALTVEGDTFAVSAGLVVVSLI